MDERAVAGIVHQLKRIADAIDQGNKLRAEADARHERRAQEHDARAVEHMELIRAESERQVQIVGMQGRIADCVDPPDGRPAAEVMRLVVDPPEGEAG